MGLLPTTPRSRTAAHAGRRQEPHNADKIPGDAKSETEAALADLKDKLKDENAETAAIRQAIDRTAQAGQKIGTALYEQSRAEQPTGAAGASAGGMAGGSSEDEVVDAEIVDDDKPEAG